MIKQIVQGRVVGETVLIEDFETIGSATYAANCYSKPYDQQAYQIREYEEGKSHIISFDDQDTGRIVCEKITNT